MSSERATVGGPAADPRAPQQAQLQTPGPVRAPTTRSTTATSTRTVAAAGRSRAAAAGRARTPEPVQRWIDNSRFRMRATVVRRALAGWVRRRWLSAVAEAEVLAAVAVEGAVAAEVEVGGFGGGGLGGGGGGGGSVVSADSAVVGGLSGGGGGGGRSFSGSLWRRRLPRVVGGCSGGSTTSDCKLGYPQVNR